MDPEKLLDKIVMLHERIGALEQQVIIPSTGVRPIVPSFRKGPSKGNQYEALRRFEREDGDNASDEDDDDSEDDEPAGDAGVIPPHPPDPFAVPDQPTDDGGNWEVVPTRTKQPKPPKLVYNIGDIPSRYLESRHKKAIQACMNRNQGLVRMIKKHITEWEIICGKQLNLVMMDYHISYVAPPDTSLVRDHFLSHLFPYPPTILDPYAGTGMCGMSLLWKFPNSKIILGQPLEKRDGLPEDLSYRICCHNIEELKKNFPDLLGSSDVNIRCASANSILRRLRPGKIDILYLDPDWRDPTGNKGDELTEDGLFNQLHDDVFIPAAQNQIIFKTIAMKTRFPSHVLFAFLERLNSVTLKYDLQFSIEFTPYYHNPNKKQNPRHPQGIIPQGRGKKGTFYFQILRLRSITKAVWKKSPSYESVYGPGFKSLTREKIEDMKRHRHHYMLPGSGDKDMVQRYSDVITYDGEPERDAIVPVEDRQGREQLESSS